MKLPQVNHSSFEFKTQALKCGSEGIVRLILNFEMECIDSVELSFSPKIEKKLALSFFLFKRNSKESPKTARNQGQSVYFLYDAGTHMSDLRDLERRILEVSLDDRQIDCNEF